MSKTVTQERATASGLDNVVAAETNLSHVDGEAGRLIVASGRWVVLEGPAGAAARAEIALENPGPGPLAFKVMVTAPAAYSFVPNSGFLEPGGATNIAVTRFSQPEDPEEPRDKIQCVSVSVAAEEVSFEDRPEPSVFSGQNVDRVPLLIQYAVGLGAGEGRGEGGGWGSPPIGWVSRWARWGCAGSS